MDKLTFFKLLGLDRRTHGGFQWPESGVVKCDHERIDPENIDACPRWPGDGLCVAINWRGATSGGYPVHYYATVAVKPADLLAFDVHEGKARARAVEVLEVRPLSGANFSGANFSGANLSGVNLSGANFSWANFSGANLSWVNFSGANLSGANFSGVNFSWTNFSGATHSPDTVWPEGFDMGRLS